MLRVFFLALGLVFVVEGMTPFLAPRLWRHAMQYMLMQNNKTLRFIGLVSMLIGLGLMCLFR